ncbi:MAG: hypothetical protein COA73_15170 [Candidatus Hydrogenedentota bacterium]|nr:MAG: hypothetical protein COA73_15170 [Candidatus Hydrogenedentota bacterium]
MILKHFRLNPIEVNCFIVACSETKEAMIVDIGEWVPEIPDYVKEQGLNLATIFITHDHHDHTDALEEATKHFGAHTISCTARPGGYTVDRVVGSDDEVTVGTLTGRVVDTCGHTPVGVSLIFPGHVFSGDALFAGSVGGTTNEEDYNMQLENIRTNLFTLPGHYEVHSGHGPSTTIAVERGSNPFFV